MLGGYSNGWEKDVMMAEAKTTNKRLTGKSDEMKLPD
jgi:hypothetical protein